MSLRHDIHAHISAHAPIPRHEVTRYFVGRGERGGAVQVAISSLLSAGHARALRKGSRHSPLLVGEVPMPPPRFDREKATRARVRRQARLVSGRCAPAAEHETPALQPIWPAVNGAPIGGLRPCIA